MDWLATLLTHELFLKLLSCVALGCGTYFILQQAATVGEITPLELQSIEELRATLAATLDNFEPWRKPTNGVHLGGPCAGDPQGVRKNKKEITTFVLTFK